MKLSKEQVDTIIKNGQAKGLSGKAVLDGLVSRGYEPEGVDIGAAKAQLPETAIETATPKKKTRVGEAIADVTGIFTDSAESVQKRADNLNEIKGAMQRGEQGKLRSLLQVIGQEAGAGADLIGNAFKGAANLFLSDEDEKAITAKLGEVGTKVMENPKVQNIVKWYGELPPEEKRDIDAAGGVVSLVTNFLGGEVATRTGTLGKEALAKGIEVGKRTAVQASKNAATELKNVGETILSSGRKAIDDLAGPDVSDATKVSLNPTEALKGTGQDIMVSVKGKLKKLSELTPEDKAIVQTETKLNLENFTKQAEQFKKDRSVPDGSPVEIVGKRADQALDIADKQRQSVGKQMGEIELKYLEKPLPISESTLGKFSETIKNFENPKYGVKNADANIVRELVSDFDALETGGATIGERLQFIRAWDDYIRDAKDAFGNFKENKTVNTRIQNAVKELKKETVDHIAEIDPQYKELRRAYAEHIQLQDIGDALLGKEGALGERIKGAATVKRAIQSNSDAGARQFLTKLKELTGYDAIKEGDIALTAMETVGDYQGLSLLNVLNEGKGGIVKRVLEKGRDLLVGSDAKRVKKYIEK